MSNKTSPASYEHVLLAFRDSLDGALRGNLPVAISGVSEPLLMLALLDITHAVRERRPTEHLVTSALNAFAHYAVDNDEARWLGDSSDVW